jgi:electron transfer flavoprotein alpha subunit
MAKVLIVAEHDGNTLNPSTGKCVTCARGFDSEGVDVAVFGAAEDTVANAATGIAGVDKVIRVTAGVDAGPVAALLAPQVAEIAAGYTHVFGPSTTFGKDLMPRVAALLGVGQLSDVMSADNAYQFQRPIYAGNAIVTVTAPEDRILVATVRTASYAAAEEGGSAAVESVGSNAALPGHTRFVELRSGSSDRPDLQTAAKVISGGRALASAENFEILFKLADTMSAAVGASRAAVDAGYVPNDMQVGQTGKIIAPALYVAIGISGAIQHLTGIKDAGTIVAINKDEEAPIFEVADIGLVGDLFKIVPELTAALEQS